MRSKGQRILDPSGEHQLASNDQPPHQSFLFYYHHCAGHCGDGLKYIGMILHIIIIIKPCICILNKQSNQGSIRASLCSCLVGAKRGQVLHTNICCKSKKTTWSTSGWEQWKTSIMLDIIILDIYPTKENTHWDSHCELSWKQPWWWASYCQLLLNVSCREIIPLIQMHEYVPGDPVVMGLSSALSLTTLLDNANCKWFSYSWSGSA